MKHRAVVRSEHQVPTPRLQPDFSATCRQSTRERWLQCAGRWQL